MRYVLSNVIDAHASDQRYMTSLGRTKTEHEPLPFRLSSVTSLFSVSCTSFFIHAFFYSSVLRTRRTGRIT